MNGEFIFLYGPPGVGKSAAGWLLADSLGLPFTDLDERIEHSHGKPVSEIFAGGGEAGFRQIEQRELRRLVGGAGGVVALGGGALLDVASRGLAEGCGQVLLLDAALEVLAQRLRTDPHPRPLLEGGLEERLAALLGQRRGHYASFPVQIDTTRLDAAAAARMAQVRLGRFRLAGMGAGTGVRVGAGLLDRAGDLLHGAGRGGRVALVSDANVAPLYAAVVEHSLQQAGFEPRSLVIPAGEEHKTLATAASLWQGFVEAGLERGGTVVALGGGVVSDLAGFAAAAYLRGVAWAVLPTSLLAMADASLGGKTGVDLPQGKNLVGAFHAPCLVLADPQTLATLPEAELRSGLAEVVKHGILSDPELFAACARKAGAGTHQAGAGARLAGSRSLSDLPGLEELVRRAMAVKVSFVNEDPYENGRRAALNLGHTIGHAVELASGYRLRHGEAVAIGLAAEARLAEQIGLAAKGLAEEIAGVLAGLRLPVDIPRGMDMEQVLAAMGRDKKNAGGRVRFVLPVRIGEVRVGVEVGDLRRYDAVFPGIARSKP